MTATKVLGKRSQEESLHTRQRILDVSERLFARSGYDGVSLREIAKECGIYHNAVRNHFASKKDIYHTVLHRWDDEIEKHVLDAMAGKQDLIDIVDSVVEEMFNFFLSKRDWVALILNAQTCTTGHPEDVSFYQEKWAGLIKTSLENLGLSLGLDYRLLLITTEGLLYHHVLTEHHYKALFAGKDVTDPQVKKQTIDHIKKVVYLLMGIKT